MIKKNLLNAQTVFTRVQQNRTILLYPSKNCLSVQQFESSKALACSVFIFFCTRSVFLFPRSASFLRRLVRHTDLHQDEVCDQKESSHSRAAICTSLKTQTININLQINVKQCE